MFSYKEFSSVPDKIYVEETWFDDLRKCASLNVKYRFGVVQDGSIWKCFELERREVIEVEDNFDNVLNQFYKDYEVDFAGHQTNLNKVASYREKPVVVV